MGDFEGGFWFCLSAEFTLQGREGMETVLGFLSEIRSECFQGRKLWRKEAKRSVRETSVIHNLRTAWSFFAVYFHDIRALDNLPQ